MRGRKPVPSRLKQVRGNPGKRPINTGEPKPRGDLSEPPEWLTDGQKQGWDYAVAHAPLGLLKRLDRSLLAVWVVAEDLHRQACEQLARFGLLTKTPHSGVPVQSPFLPIVNKQAQVMLKAAAELGFTPSSRSRISLDPPRPATNPFASNGRRPGSDPAWEEILRREAQDHDPSLDGRKH